MLPKHLVGFPPHGLNRRGLGGSPLVSMLPKHLVGFPPALKSMKDTMTSGVSMLPKHLVGFPPWVGIVSQPMLSVFQCFLSIWWDFHQYPPMHDLLKQGVSMLPKHLVGFPPSSGRQGRPDPRRFRCVSMLPKHLVGFPPAWLGPLGLKRRWFRSFQCFLSIWWDFHGARWSCATRTQRSFNAS